MTVGTIDQIMPRSHSVNTIRMPAQTLLSEVNGYMSIPTVTSSPCARPM